MEINEKNSLGEWAYSFAGASNVFIKNGLDFCCGGSQSLENACSEKGVNFSNIIQDIYKASEKTVSPKWSQMQLSELIDDVLERFHKKHREDLKFLIPLANKVESVHADRSEVPDGLANHLEMLLNELESHMQKEEMILFPMIKAGNGAMAVGPVNVMMHEHIDHGNNLSILRKLAKNYQLPQEACGSWVALYKGVANLEREIMEHIATENNLLFPRALRGE